MRGKQLSANGKNKKMGRSGETQSRTQHNEIKLILLDFYELLHKAMIQLSVYTELSHV